MSLPTFKEKLARYLPYKVEFKLTKNRSTMLSLLPGTAKRLSMHEMFLEAPEEVVEAIAAYIARKRKGRKEYSQRLKAYINAHYDRYIHSLPTLRSQGGTYDLDQLMASINKEYFAGALTLAITWFRGRRARRHILFGRYESSRRLVKINDRLDQPFVPDYFIRFIIYHEMVHHVVPSYLDERGRLCMHGPEFKRVERRFNEYAKARLWEKQHKEKLFSN